MRSVHYSRNFRGVIADGQNEYSVCSWKALQIFRKYTEYIFVKHKAIPMTMLR